MIDTGKTIFVFYFEQYLAKIKHIYPAMTRFFVLLCFFNLLYTPGFAQTNARGAGAGIETNLIYGKIIKHSKKFLGPVPDRSTAVELNYVWQTFGKKDWHQRRNYPLVGFAFMYTNYGIDSIYGRSFAIYPNLQIPLITGKKLEWTAKVSFGLGYTTGVYERIPVWDTLNTAIGSHFNNFSYFSTDLRYRINDKWDVQIGGNFSHMSNAAFRQPNLGINMYGAHVGLRYFPVSSKPERLERALVPLKNRWLVQARAGISATELSANDGPLYPVYLASVYASKRYHSKNKAFAGVDYSYHEHIYAFLRNNEIAVGKERANSWKSAIFVGDEFLFGRIGVTVQVGVYLKQGMLKQDPYYQKLGANVYLLQNEKGPIKELFASCLLKTHKSTAELVEMGLGIGL